MFIFIDFSCFKLSAFSTDWFEIIEVADEFGFLETCLLRLGLFWYTDQHDNLGECPLYAGWVLLDEMISVTILRIVLFRLAGSALKYEVGSLAAHLGHLVWKFQKILNCMHCQGLIDNRWFYLRTPGSLCPPRSQPAPPTLWEEKGEIVRKRDQFG